MGLRESEPTMRKRKYSVFRKCNGRWQRMSIMAFDKQKAVRVFQNILLTFAFSGEPMELRPVKDEPLTESEAQEIDEQRLKAFQSLSGSSL